MHKNIEKGTLVSIVLSLLVTIITMYDMGYPRFNENEWWLFLWSFSPYVACSFLLLKPVTITVLSLIGSIVFLLSTIYLLLDSLYLHYGPEALLIYMFLPVVQFGVIGAYLVIVLICKVFAPGIWNRIARNHGKTVPR